MTERKIVDEITAYDGGQINIGLAVDKGVTIREPSNQHVLLLTKDGKLLRNGVLVEDLERHELIQVVHELVEIVLNR